MIWKLIIVIGLFGTVTVSKTADIQYHCPSHNPQKSLDFKRLMGQWYIIEIVDHMHRQGHGLEINLEFCPTLHLVQEDYNNFRLKWTEPDSDLYYNAKRTDPKALGFWISSGPNTEPFLDKHSFHHQYTGTIEIMKAVGNHAVLTFCKSDGINSQLFSVVIARDAWLPRADTRSINRMLESRGLTINVIKRACNNAGSHTFAAALFAIIFLRFLL